MKSHTIPVTKRCIYHGLKGRCKRMTTITHPYCAQHTKSEMGLVVKKSLIPAAGLGLFAAREFKKDEHICEYTGQKLTIAAYDRKYAKDSMGAYGMHLDSTHVLDAAKTSSGIARYACDYHGSGKKPNAEYVTDGVRIYVVAIKKIKVDDEILTDYGDEMHRAMGV